MSMAVSMRRMPVPTGRAARVQIPLEVLHARPVLLHNLLDVGDAVKVHLELVQLLYDVGVARNLLVGAVDDVPRAVVLDLGEHLGLLAEVLDILLDADHEPVKVAPQRGERRAVEQQEPLAAGPAGGAGAAGPAVDGGLALPQQLDLLRGQAQLRVRDGVGRHCGRKRAGRRGAREAAGLSQCRSRHRGGDDDGVDGLDGGDGLLGRRWLVGE